MSMVLKIFKAMLGEKLRIIRKSRGLSLRDLSRRTGIDEPHLAKIEGGKVDIRMSTFVKIMHKLGGIHGPTWSYLMVDAEKTLANTLLRGGEHDNRN